MFFYRWLERLFAVGVIVVFPGPSDSFDGWARNQVQISLPLEVGHVQELLESLMVPQVQFDVVIVHPLVLEVSCFQKNILQ